MSLIDNKKIIDGVEYLIFDPSKNITALVISNVEEIAYTEISKKIMNKESQVEQVGFLYYEDGCDIFLHMAGGEFCGNATMCAAIYCAMENNLSDTKLKVKVYSIDELINVDVKKPGNGEWEGIVKMPKATEIREVAFSKDIVLPVVFYSSIAHVIIGDNGDVDYEFIKNNAETFADKERRIYLKGKVRI